MKSCIDRGQLAQLEEHRLDMARVTGSSPVLPTIWRQSVNILDWIKSRKSTMGEASGHRINEAIANQERLNIGMPPQRRALFIDTDGTKSYHDLSVESNGKPQEEITIGIFRESQMPDRKVYHYDSDNEGYMVYRQV